MSLETMETLDLAVRSRLVTVANGQWGLGLTDHQIKQFIRYAELLVEWNAKFNLTRLITPEQIATGHFLDSLSILHAITIPNGSRVIDVGSGAGLPGIALKIARPDLTVTLLDSTAKKLRFCDVAIDDLRLAGVSTQHARAEEISNKQEASYGVAVARALAPLERLLPWCAPFVKPGGCIVALKGAKTEEELSAAKRIAKKLFLILKEPIPIDLTGAGDTSVRCAVVAVKRAGPL